MELRFCGLKNKKGLKRVYYNRKKGGFVNSLKHLSKDSVILDEASVLLNASVLSTSSTNMICDSTIKDYSVVKGTSNIVSSTISGRSFVEDSYICSSTIENDSSLKSPQICNSKVRQSNISGSALIQNANIDSSIIDGDVSIIGAKIVDAHIHDAVRIYDRACVSKARIYDKVIIANKAFIEGDVSLSDNATIEGHAKIHDLVKVDGNAHISGYAYLSGNAHISGDACVCGNAYVMGNATIEGQAVVKGIAIIAGNAIVRGDAQVFCGYIGKDALVEKTSHYFVADNVTNKNSLITFYRTASKGINVKYGDFEGSIHEFTVFARSKYNTRMLLELADVAMRRIRDTTLSI